MTFDTLRYRAEEATRTAEQAYHELRGRTDTETLIERSRRHEVSRGRFRTLVDRIAQTGAPYGAHTIVYRPSGELLLVRHEGVDLWVLPGGGVDEDERFRDAAEREVEEEAGVEVDYDGLAILTRVEIACRSRSVTGVIPVFAAAAETTTPNVDDPDGEISRAKWFETLPDDTRDRDDVLAWHRHRFG